MKPRLRTIAAARSPSAALGRRLPETRRIAIRPFTLDAYEAVLKLWQACDGIGLSEADSRSGIRAYLRRNPGLSFVARHGGQVVGAVLCGHDGRRGYLHHLAVHPRVRRRAIGRQLVGRCLEALRRAGIQKCHIFVYGRNRRGRAFWNAEAWTPRHDLTLMSKSIAANTVRNARVPCT